MANLIIILFIKRGSQHLIAIIICSMACRLVECNTPQLGCSASSFSPNLTNQKTSALYFLPYTRVSLLIQSHPCPCCTYNTDTVFHKPFPFGRWSGTIYLSNAGLSGTHYIKHFFFPPQTQRRHQYRRCFAQIP